MLQNDVHAVSISLIYTAIFHCIFKHLPGYNSSFITREWADISQQAVYQF